MTGSVGGQSKDGQKGVELLGDVIADISVTLVDLGRATFDQGVVSLSLSSPDMLRMSANFLRMPLPSACVHRSGESLCAKDKGLSSESLGAP